MAINAYFHITDAGAGDKSGDSWANAMDEAAFETHLEGAVVAGDVHFVKDGSYTMDSDIDFSARDGTAVSPIVIIGVKSGTTNEGANVAYSDWSRDAADRPYFDGVTYRIRTGDYTVIRNIEMVSESSRVIYAAVGCIIENCKLVNDNGSSSTKYCLDVALGSLVINNEMSSANTRALLVGSHGVRVLFNYIHDCTDATNGIGISHDGSYTCIGFNIFDNLTIAIASLTDENVTALNNTFYETDQGVTESDGASWCCINNIMEGNNTDGFKWTTQTDINFFWNNWGNDARCNDMWDTIDVTTCFQDYPNAAGLFGDPLFTNPGVDHSLQDGSPCIGEGMSIESGVG